MSLPSISLAEAITHRHSVYPLTDKLPPNFDPTTLKKILEGTVLNAPSAFNNQTTRIALVVGEEHKRFWDTVKEEDIKTANGDEASIERKNQRLANFAAAYGTVLFFESQKVVQESQEKFAVYKDLFPEWSLHTAGIHHYIVWTSFLSHEGMGANLQHYQFLPNVNEKTTKQYGLPDDWVLTAQLVFGAHKEGAYPTEPKPKNPTSESVRIFGL